jgi:hypothetical protein
MPSRIACSLLFLLLPSLAWATDIQVTDSQGTTVVVKDAVVDYGGMLASDPDKEGLRIQQGDALVRLKWSDVQSVAVTRVDTSVKPARVDLEVVLASGTRAPATLFRKGAMTLSGKSPLGDYTIAMEKVRRLVPVR